jgi:hypothetical protein
VAWPTGCSGNGQSANTAAHIPKARGPQRLPAVAGRLPDGRVATVTANERSSSARIWRFVGRFVRVMTVSINEDAFGVRNGRGMHVPRLTAEVGTSALSSRGEGRCATIGP